MEDLHFGPPKPRALAGATQAARAAVVLGSLIGTERALAEDHDEDAAAEAAETPWWADADTARAAATEEVAPESERSPWYYRSGVRTPWFWRYAIEGCENCDEDALPEEAPEPAPPGPSIWRGGVNLFGAYRHGIEPSATAERQHGMLMDSAGLRLFVASDIDPTPEQVGGFSLHGQLLVQANRPEDLRFESLQLLQLEARWTAPTERVELHAGTLFRQFGLYRRYTLRAANNGLLWGGVGAGVRIRGGRYEIFAALGETSAVASLGERGPAFGAGGGIIARLSPAWSLTAAAELHYTRRIDESAAFAGDVDRDELARGRVIADRMVDNGSLANSLTHTRPYADTRWGTLSQIRYEGEGTVEQLLFTARLDHLAPDTVYEEDVDGETIQLSLPELSDARYELDLLGELALNLGGRVTGVGSLRLGRSIDHDDPARDGGMRYAAGVQGEFHMLDWMAALVDASIARDTDAPSSVFGDQENGQEGWTTMQMAAGLAFRPELRMASRPRIRALYAARTTLGARTHHTFALDVAFSL